MCDKCNGFIERVRLNTPREYLDRVRQLIELVNRGSFSLVGADCPLEDLFKEQWPGDVLTHEFRCSSCGKLFELFADTFHGSAWWHEK